jgi:hypothetical protein
VRPATARSESDGGAIGVANVPGLPQFLTPSQGWTAGVIQPAGQKNWSVQSLYTTADGGLHWAAIPMPATDLVK